MTVLKIYENSTLVEERQLYKSLTTIGSDKHSDIQLKHSKIPSVAAHISHQGQTFTLNATDPNFRISVNNKYIHRHVLKADDNIKIGQFMFVVEETNSKKTSSSKEGRFESEISAYKRLLNFSKQVSKEHEISNVLTALLDEIIEVTNAEKGFLVLTKENASNVRLARDQTKQNLKNTVDELSDSILKKVLDTKEALVVSDATSDTDFKSSYSVINYRLTSVMCAPLLHLGRLHGAIYVGNNSFTDAFDQKSLEVLTIFATQAALLVQQAMHVDFLTKETQQLKNTLEFTKFGGIVGACSHMQRIFEQVNKFANTDANIIIRGEVGTGKELIAREIHRRSPRASGPFVVVKCASIPEDQLNKDLFGLGNSGRLSLANHGTLFLDEFTELPFSIQDKLLSKLNTEKAGANSRFSSQDFDIRLISSTSYDAKKLAKNNTLRLELFYHLNTIQVELPPLRDRGNDILVIANYFLQKYTKIYGRSKIFLTETAQNALLNSFWPGNIRELENRIKRAIVLCNDNRILPEDLSISETKKSKIVPLSGALEKFKQQYIQEALERNAGNKTQTAKELGVDPRTIFRHLEEKKKDTTINA